MKTIQLFIKKTIQKENQPGPAHCSAQQPRTARPRPMLTNILGPRGSVWGEESREGGEASAAPPPPLCRR